MLYTGQGDTGYTTVIGGPSLPKCMPRLQAIGALDEVNAQLGLARALLSGTPWHDAVLRVQQTLHLMMADLAMPARAGAGGHYLTEEHLRLVEADLAAWEAETGGFRGFRTPGATVHGAHLHVARTIIRRAEREAVALRESGESIPPLTLTLLNRLSSWAYALALRVEEAA